MCLGYWFFLSNAGWNLEDSPQHDWEDKQPCLTEVNHTSTVIPPIANPDLSNMLPWVSVHMTSGLFPLVTHTAAKVAAIWGCYLPLLTFWSLPTVLKTKTKAPYKVCKWAISSPHSCLPLAPTLTFQFCFSAQKFSCKCSTSLPQAVSSFLILVTLSQKSNPLQWVCNTTPCPHGFYLSVIHIHWGTTWANLLLFLYYRLWR